MTKTPWRKSSRSGSGGSNCVETAKLGTEVGIRDSKLGDESPIIRIADEDFAGFLAIARH